MVTVRRKDRHTYEGGPDGGKKKTIDSLRREKEAANGQDSLPCSVETQLVNGSSRGCDTLSPLSLTLTHYILTRALSITSNQLASFNRTLTEDHSEKAHLHGEGGVVLDLSGGREGKKKRGFFYSNTHQCI